ncbi:MAG: diguanylate cyclase [Lachnospiraceae bacterium]|nr:diguanylate cyclase [Lachnospiraceae bacterium]
MEVQNRFNDNNLLDVAFQTMLKNSRDMMFIKDINSVYVAASGPFVKMVGKETEAQLLGKTDAEIFDDKNLAKRYLADDRKLIAGGKDLVDYIEPIPEEEEGKARYGSTSKYILRNQEGKAMGILGITRDITRDYVARQHYQHELQYLFELPKDTYAISYVDVDSWRIISQRRQLIKQDTLQECQTVEQLVDAAIDSIMDKNCDAAKFYKDFTAENIRRIYEQGENHISFTYQRKMADGMERWVHNEIRFLLDIDSGHLCAMLSAKDIDEEKREQQELAVAAKMDRMTMLLNRETTMKYIRRVLEENKEEKHVLFMFDVDNFKHLNDTMGHQKGDEFLVELARGLKKSFRDSDIVGRVGGDEFFALMKNVPDTALVERKANELLSTIQEICAGYADIRLSGSIGIGIYPENGKTLDELYGQADAALYQAKRKGKNQYVFASS